MYRKRIASAALVCILSALLLSSLIPSVSGAPEKYNLENENVKGSVTYSVGDNPVKEIKAGQDFSAKVLVKNETDKTLTDIKLELFSGNEKLDSKSIDNLSGNENRTKTLSGRAGKAETGIMVKINGTKVTEATKKIKSSKQAKGGGGGYPLTILLVVAAVLFAAGVGLGYKAFGGPSRGRPPIRTTPSKRSSSDASDAMREAADALDRGGNLLSEVEETEVDISTEEKLAKSAQDFHEMAEEEHSDDRFDSAYAYARAASTLGQGVSDSLEDKLSALQQAEDNVAAAREALEDVEGEIKKAKDRGIDADPARSLGKLASKIIESAPEAVKPETYRFQSETAQKIAEHARDSLESSISGQEDQINRTEERIDDADEALEGVEELIEKRRDEFDTLIPEYWLKIAEEIREIADDTGLNAETREVMADTTIRICEWIESMFERRDIRSRMKEEGGGGGIIRR